MPLFPHGVCPRYTAEEVSRTYQFEEKFWRQVAKIMVQLASIQLPKIGSIYQDGNAPALIVVGPFVETGSGPYQPVAEFYAEYPMALSKSLGEPPVDKQEEVVEAFQSLTASFPIELGDDSPGFGLANYDLNPNNFIIDQDFNVLAIIDWDSVVAVPDAALYHFPYLVGFDCAVPGEVDTHPKVAKRHQLGRQFAEVVQEVAREMKQQGKDEGHGLNKQQRAFLFSRNGFFSKEAAAFRSLVYIKTRQDWVNHAWVEGLKWLSEHDEVEVIQFYLQN